MLFAPPVRSSAGHTTSSQRIQPHLRGWPLSPDAFDALMDSKGFARAPDRELAKM